ncbi:MAG: polymer-forming cytoskeletal protein, partial [Betaproteobacteria bacterium]|nr:polymer-forming cytoskeletal protein [Betaproteobacteria bacterium]
CQESLELQASCRVKGDVHYKSLEIQLGAVIEGMLVHRGADANKAVELKLAS